jgi:hypothetical protein
VSAARRRASFGLLLLGGLLFAMGMGGGGWLLFERAVHARLVAQPPPPAPTPEPVGEPILEPTVVRLDGSVERSDPNSDWRPVRLGERLHAEDAIRTGQDGRADLGLGEHSRITVAERSELTVRELSTAVYRWNLVRGRIGVDYRPDGARLLRVESEGGSTAAETSGARFSILATGEALTVAAESGSVNLSAAGKAVVVAAGEEAVARTDEAPSAPRPIPAALLLKVVQAGGDPRTCARLRGSTDPGAEVTVDGQPVPTGSGGGFETLVPGRSGKRETLIAVRDASGRLTERRLRCDASADGRAPLREGPIRDLKVRWKDAAPN